MPTCPNCGEIVMNGDPYCPNCGTTFRQYSDEEEDYEPPKKDRNKLLNELFRELSNLDLSSDEKLDLFKEHLFQPDYLLSEIRESIHREERLYGCRFIMVDPNPYPHVYMFLREDKYRDVVIFERCYADYMPGKFDPEMQEFSYSYDRLYSEEKFKREVSHLESEGFKFVDVKSRLGSWNDVIEASFSNGYVKRIYHIDDDLNFEKLSYDFFDVSKLYWMDLQCHERNLLLDEIRRFERQNNVKLKRMSHADYVAFDDEISGAVRICRYDLASSALREIKSFSPKEFDEIYAFRYSF